MAHDVFISYSSKDKPTADATCAKLEARGIRRWVAPRDILPGADWSASILDAIHGARAMVLVFSAHANASPQIKREVERAVNQGIPVIPLRIENVQPEKSLEYFISTPHWLDAFSPPLEQHLAYLADVIRHILDGQDVPEKPPPAPPPWWRGRLGLAAAAGLLPVLLAVAWFSFLRPPPGFAGTWTATTLDIRQFNPENTLLNAEVPPPFLGNALKGPDTRGVLTIAPSGQFTLAIDGEDHGTLSAAPPDMGETNTLTFVSDITQQSFRMGALLFRATPNSTGVFSPQTDPPPDGQTPYTLDLMPAHANIGPFSGQPDYQGSPDASGNMRTLDLIAGTWTPEAFGQNAADPANTVSAVLTLTSGGHYTLAYSLRERSLWHAANGSWTRTIPAVNGMPANLTDGGTYVFTGRNRLTLYDQDSATVWQRSP